MSEVSRLDGPERAQRQPADRTAAASGRHRAAGRWRREAALAVGGGLLLALATAAGVWFAPFLAGLALGLVTCWWRTRLRTSVLATAVAVVAGWAAPLAWRAGTGEPVLGTARTTAALAGLPASGWLLVAVTVLIAALQGLAGLWLVRAAVSLRRA